MKFVGYDRLYGVDGEYRTPYMTRLSIGRLRLHIFHRGDADPDCHDHPWDFWTFPLTAYVEEQTKVFSGGIYAVRRNVVPAFRWSFRPAEHTHRVLGRFGGYEPGPWFGGPMGRAEARLQNRTLIVRPGRIITIVWLGHSRRKWGFLRNRDGNWCWTPWKEYVFGGGKHAPCEPGPGGSA